MKKNRSSTVGDIRRHAADGNFLQYPGLQPAPAAATGNGVTFASMMLMREMPSVIDVEDVLSSRAIARTEIRHNDASPQRLRSIMEKDVDVVALPKAKLFHPNRDTAESTAALPVVRDFLLAYAKDYLVVERRFGHLSYARLFAEIPERRAELVEALPRQLFETDLLEPLPPSTVTSGNGGGKWRCCDRCVNSNTVMSAVGGSKRFSVLSDESTVSRGNGAENFHALAGDFLIDTLYDVRLRQRISENFHVDFNAPHIRRLLPSSSTARQKCHDALFAVQSHDLANVFLVFRMEKVLQGGDVSECIEPYIKDGKNREKLAAAAADNCQRLGAYRMPLGWMAVDLRTVVENARRGAALCTAEPVVNVSADDELYGTGADPQDDTFSVISVDRLSLTAAGVNVSEPTNSRAVRVAAGGAISPLTLRSERDDAERTESAARGGLRPQFSVTSVGAAAAATDDSGSGGSPGTSLFDVLQSMQHVVVSVNSFYKQEYDRLSDEELLELLAGRRGGKNGGSGGSGAAARLKTFPVELQFELAARCSDEELRRGVASGSGSVEILPPELGAGEAPVGSDVEPSTMGSTFVKDVLMFPRPNTFAVNHFYRNLLYIYPKCVNLSAKSGNARNVCLRVQLRDAGAAPVPILYERDGSSRLVTEYACIVSYHSKTPQFLDEIKVRLPLEINDGYHILFSFSHVSCKAGAKPTGECLETPIGYTWLPLFANGELQVGEFALPISLDPLPAGLCYLSPLLNVPNLKWLDNHKCLFSVSLRAVSTVHPLDNHLNAFFNAYSELKCSPTGGRNSSGVGGSTVSPAVDEPRLRLAIRNIMKSRPEPMVSFLYIIIDKLLALISCPPFPDVAKSCFETICQLVKVGTMLLDGGNVDELGRSQLFSAYIFYHKLTQSDRLHGSGTLCDQIEAAAIAALTGQRVTTATADGKNTDDAVVMNLIRTYEKLDFFKYAGGDETDDLNAEDWPNKKLLHEEVMYQFASSVGTVRETACLYAWFFFELTLKAMAEYLSARNRFFLPRKLRFRDDFHQSVNGTVAVMIAEILERHSKDANQARQLNNALAFFLRDAFLLMDRTFVLRQAKLYHDEMAKRINSSISPAMQALLVSLKLGFFRILCSHEHFLFLNLPFENMPQTSAFACTIATARQSDSPKIAQPVPCNGGPVEDSGSQSAKDLSADYLRNHFLLGVVLSDLSAILGTLRDPATHATHSACFEQAVRFVQVLLLCHENDARLAVDTSLKFRVAALYLPLVGIVVDGVDCLYDPFRDGAELAADFGSLNPNKSFDDLPHPADTGSVLNKELTKELLISFCWVISNVDKPSLLRYLQSFSAPNLCRFVDVLHLCVSLFEYRPTYGVDISAAAQDHPELSRVKSVSVVAHAGGGLMTDSSHFADNDPTIFGARELHSSLSCSHHHPQCLNRKQSYGTQSVITTGSSAHGYAADMVNSLVDFNSYGSGSMVCYCRDASFSCSTLDAAARNPTASSWKQRAAHGDDAQCPMARHTAATSIGNAIRWRSNEQLLKHAGTPNKTVPPKLTKDAEVLLERQLSIEVSFAALSTLETIVELAAMPSMESFRFIVPSLIQLLAHMMSCNASVEALESIFYVQRRIVADFPELIFEQRTELCTEMCYQLLRHMASRIPAIRSQATGSLYLLMRHSFVRSQTFARVKMQVTMSLSSLVSNSLTALAADDAPWCQLNEQCLRRSLKTMLDYMDADLSGSSSAKDTNFSSQVKSLTLNLNMILSDTVKMKHYSDDFEMLIDLMYRIAKGYQNNPDLRITWLLSIASKHLERDNYMEAAHCALHCAALVAEYLAMLHHDAADAMAADVPDSSYPLPQSTDEFAEISGNILEESAISDDVIHPEEDGICESSHFSVDGFIRLIEKCLLFFEKAHAFELISPLYKLILPIFERQKHHYRLSEIYQKLAENEKRIDGTPRIHENISDAFDSPLSSSDKRCFGTYFRVGFYGSKFGDLNGEEFIYKEPSITKLAEISHRLETFYAEKFGSRSVVEMIKDSSDVDPSQLNEEKAYIQVTYVEPHFEEWERRRRQTYFRRHYGLNAFSYATPFTAGGRAHGLLAEQFKRRTILRTHNSFPYVKTRLRVVAREQCVLSPIQVAIEDIEKKTRELASAIRLQPPDAKILQMFLQGCIGTTVNVGPIQIAKVFLRPDESCSVPSLKVMDHSEFLAHQDRLRLCFKDFSRKCHEALSINATLIEAERADYQNELRKNYADFTVQLAEILAAYQTTPASANLAFAFDTEEQQHSNAARLIATQLRGPATAV